MDHAAEGLRPKRPPASQSLLHQVYGSFLENEVSPALFATVDTHMVEVPTPVSNFTYLEAALEGEWPCEQQEPFLDPTCDVHPFPLFGRGR